MNHVKLIAFFCMMVMFVKAEPTPNIIDFSGGVITWSNVNPSLFYSLEWQSALDSSNQWNRSFRNLQDIQSTNLLMGAEVPMFFRVVGSTAELSTETVSASTPIIDEGYYQSTDLLAVESDLVSSNIKSGVTIFGITGSMTNSYDLGAGLGSTEQLPLDPAHGQEYFDTDLVLWVKFNSSNSKWETLTGVAIYEE